jgi:PIN domain nuclease of toxin-antitoxin system
VRVLADSHTILWHLQGSPRLSNTAAIALTEAEVTGGVVVSVATLIDLWHVAQTTDTLPDRSLDGLRELLASSRALFLQPIDVAVIDATNEIPGDLLPDPWDRFIVGTARALVVPLVTRDAAIRDSGLVATIW